MLQQHPTTRLAIFTAALVAVTTFCGTISTPGNAAAVKSCVTCQPNGCYPLDPKQVLVPVGTDTSTTCVAYTVVFAGHCATTPRQIEEIYTKIDNDHSTMDGTCYKTDCANATPLSQGCLNPWVAPWVLPILAAHSPSTPATAGCTHTKGK